MANWTYGDWRSFSGAAKVARLASHMQEVSERITENLALAGRSIGVDPLNAYLKTLQTDFNSLGGNTPVASRRGGMFVPAWGCDPEVCR